MSPWQPVIPNGDLNILYFSGYDHDEVSGHSNETTRNHGMSKEGRAVIDLPFAHVQRYARTDTLLLDVESLHLAPFLQGLLEHSLTSTLQLPLLLLHCPFEYPCFAVSVHKPLP